MGKWKNDYNATRKYNQRWEEGRDWLHGTPDEKCYCSICNCTFNPKKSVVKQHEISGKHRNAVLGIKPRRVYRKVNIFFKKYKYFDKVVSSLFKKCLCILFFI